MIDKYGEKHGIDTTGMSRQEILDLRKNPKIASTMAAEFASENERYLNRRWGGEIGSTELYFAHFLGAPKAAAFLNARDENPLQQAAVLFPKAAKANYNVFYERGTGRAKSLDEVYAFFDKKFEVRDFDLACSIEQQNEAETASMNSVVFQKQIPNYYSPIPNFQLVQSPVELMILSQLDLPGLDNKNSLF